MSEKQFGKTWRTNAGTLACVRDFAFKRDQVVGFGFADVYIADVYIADVVNHWLNWY